MDLYRESDRKYRLEIEGLRAIAAILVAVYHIWLGNVSGGVDVFFVVSGFLITTSLLNRYERYGELNPVDYLLKLGKRLFPSAFTVLLFVIITSFLFLPQTQWISTIKEIAASLIYIENWQLAMNSVDYLAQNNAASPVQHFWAMSAQFQFYAIWTIVLILAVFIAEKTNTKLRKSLLMILITIFVVSLSYSIYITTINQPWAYFDTFARVWEFAAGGILCLLIVNISLSKKTSFILGWIGLIGLISCGLILQVSTVFPGYAAMWPIMSAVFILIAGNKGGKSSVYSLLSSKYLVKFGKISYGFYLWHWPLLILYFNISRNEHVSIIGGLAIILLSIILSIFTTNFIEKPIRNWNVKSKPKLAITLITISMPIVFLTGLWTWYIKDAKITVASENLNEEDYPGAVSMTFNDDFISDSPYYPQVIQVRNDFPKSTKDGCHQNMEEADAIECEYGNIDNPDKTIALVGGSHSQHWLPALEIYAKENSIKILNYTKDACRFSSESYLLHTEIARDTCTEWNENVMKELVKNKPDLVFTTADASEWKGIPAGYIDKWEELKKNDINVLAIKDTPRAEFDIPTCIDMNGEDAEECFISNDLEDLTDEIEKLTLSNVYYSDLTNKFCENDFCKPIVGNILVYKDAHHITSTYSKTLAPFVGEELNKAFEHFN